MKLGMTGHPDIVYLQIQLGISKHEAIGYTERILQYAQTHLAGRWTTLYVFDEIFNFKSAVADLGDTLVFMNWFDGKEDADGNPVIRPNMKYLSGLFIEGD